MVYDTGVDGSAGRARTKVWAVFSVVALLALNIDDVTLWAELPWESILGFADVAIVMAVTVWLTHRHIRLTQRNDHERFRQEAFP